MPDPWLPFQRKPHVDANVDVFTNTDVYTSRDVHMCKRAVSKSLLCACGGKHVQLDHHL